MPKRQAQQDDTRSETMKAVNAFLTSPDEDLRSKSADYPPSHCETVDPSAKSVTNLSDSSDANSPAVPARQSRRSQSSSAFDTESVNSKATEDRPDPSLYKGQSPQFSSEPKPPFPVQHQGEPGLENELNPRPRYIAPLYKAAGKLKDKVALITGGDSGIGRSVALLYAREGADVAIVYLPSEQSDALETQHVVTNEGRKCLLIPGDLTDANFCKECVEQTVRELGKLDILVSNAAYQSRKEDILQLSEEEWDTTFKTNVYAYFYLVKAAVTRMKPGSAIIATSSETGLFGNASLPDYSSTKGAINAFTKSIAQSLIKKGIRVNAVAPGPVWTPLNPADQGLSADKVAKFGQKTPMGRPAQPEEIAPSYVFLASDADSSYITGIILEQLGGETGSS